MMKKRAKLGTKKEKVSYNRYKLHARVDEKFNILLKAESELRRIPQSDIVDWALEEYFFPNKNEQEQEARWATISARLLDVNKRLDDVMEAQKIDNEMLLYFIRLWFFHNPILPQKQLQDTMEQVQRREGRMRETATKSVIDKASALDSLSDEIESTRFIDALKSKK